MCCGGVAQHLAGVLEDGFGDGGAADHSGYFGYPLVGRQGCYGYGGPLALYLLLDTEVAGASACDLRKVGDTDDLCGAGEVRHLFADHTGGSTADTYIDLVE